MKASPHRPTVALIDLAAIQFNVDQIAKHIPSDKEKWAVVKANAYGHGVLEVCQALEDRVSSFCVSNIDEALEIRHGGFAHPILVLGVTDWSAVDLAKQEGIMLTISSREWVEEALNSGVDFSGLDYQVKVDSGMGRIGFRNQEELAWVLATMEDYHANFQGIFTHFATADEVSQEQFDQQLERFKEVLAALPIRPAKVHASNSATTLWHSESIFDAVRLGDIIYGLNPSGRTLELPYEIRPALSLETELVQVKILEAGHKVGYGGTYQTSGQEVIGTLPIGYADGWTRDMQGFEVLVDGQLCPIVGRVSMDQTTIRLPDVYPIGTPVTLIGQNGSRQITTTDVADYRGTINYEVVCLLSDRVPRVYKK